MTAMIDNILAAEKPSFARSVTAIITGDVDSLRQELAADPLLARARSASPHRATLLHYVAANGIESELQRQVPNSDEIAAALLDAGADVDAECDAYGGQCMTLDLLVSSDHPYEAGVTGKVVTLLCASGAAVNGRDNDGSPLATALYFGILDGVQALLACRARTDNPIFAAAAGDADWIRAWLDENVGTVGRPGPSYFPLSADRVVAAEQALVFASMCGQVEIVRWREAPTHRSKMHGIAQPRKVGSRMREARARHLRRRWHASCPPAAEPHRPRPPCRRSRMIDAGNVAAVHCTARIDPLRATIFVSSGPANDETALFANLHHA